MVCISVNNLHAQHKADLSSYQHAGLEADSGRETSL